MRMYLLSSDEDTLTGMRLAGIDGEIITGAAELLEAAQREYRGGRTGILLVAKTLGEAYPETVVEIKKQTGLLVTQVPDMQNPSSSGDSITGYVRDAIGVNVE